MENSRSKIFGRINNDLLWGGSGGWGGTTWGEMPDIVCTQSKINKFNNNNPLERLMKKEDSNKHN